MKASKYKSQVQGCSSKSLLSNKAKQNKTQIPFPANASPLCCIPHLESAVSSLVQCSVPMESHGHDQHRIISPNYLTMTVTILIWNTLIGPALGKSGLCQSTQHLPSFWEPETCFPSHFTSVSTAVSRVSRNQNTATSGWCQLL